MISMTAHSRVRLRATLYILVMLLFIIFVFSFMVGIIQTSRCLVSPLNPVICPFEGFRSSMSQTSDDDYQWKGKQTYVNSLGLTRNLGNQSIGYFITLLVMNINVFISYMLSLIVVWLIDRRSTPNGFTRLVQWFSACQVFMDFGFVIAAVAATRGSYNQFTYKNEEANTFWTVVHGVGVAVQEVGDTSSVMFTTVMSYTFYQIAHKQTSIDIMKYLWWGIFMSVGTSVVVDILQKLICEPPAYKNECSIIKVRGWISVVCIVVNFTFGLSIWKMLSRMPAGKKKDAISSLSSRIQFYAGWVAFSRIGYIGLTLSTGTLNLNFYDHDHTRFVNVLSSLTYLLWLPTGTGFAIYYLYTHPDEFRYFWDLVRRREGSTFLPSDLCELYDEVCMSWCPSKYPDADGGSTIGSSNGEKSTTFNRGSVSSGRKLQTKASKASIVGVSMQAISSPMQERGSPKNNRQDASAQPKSTKSKMRGIGIAGSPVSTTLIMNGQHADEELGAEEYEDVEGYEESGGAAALGRPSRSSLANSTSSSRSYGRELERQDEDDLTDALLDDDHGSSAAASGRAVGIELRNSIGAGIRPLV